jgi:hypothetical protein
VMTTARKTQTSSLTRSKRQLRAAVSNLPL